MANQLLYKDIAKYSYWSFGGQLPYTSDRSISQYKKMRNHPMISMGINFIVLGLSNVPRVIEAENPEHSAIIDAMIEPIWGNLLRDSFECLYYGFKPFELRYKPGVVKYTIDDQKKTFKGILPKQPKALDPEYIQILIDEQGGLIGFKQSFTDQKILVEDRKCLIVINNCENGNYYGISALEPIYSMWYISNINTQFHTRWLERKGTGLFVGRYPTGNDGKDNSEVMMEILDSIMEGTTVALPSNTDENGNHFWDISLLNGEDKTDSFLAFHEYLNKMILRGLVIPERALTQEEVGARASVEAYVDVFTTRKQALLDMVVDYINNYMISHLVELNFGKDVEIRVRAGKIEDKTKETAAKIIEKLIEQSKIEIDPDWLSKMSGIPLADTEESEEIQEETSKIQKEPTKPEEHAMSEDRHRQLTAREQRFELSTIDSKMTAISEKFQNALKENLENQLERIKNYLRKNLNNATISVAEGIEINRNQIKRIYREYITEAYNYCYSIIERGVERKIAMAEGEFIGFRVAMSAEKLITDIETAVKYSVGQNIARGLGVSEILEGATQAMGQFTDGARLSQIAETEISFALSKSNEQYYRDNVKAVKNGTIPAGKLIKRYQYTAILDSRVCSMCEKLDKMIVDADSPIRWKYDPPLHYMCRCVWMPITQEEISDPRAGETNLTIDLETGRPYTLDSLTAYLGTDVNLRTFK